MYFLQSWLVVSTTYGVRWIVKHGAMCQVAHTESKIPLTRKYKLVEDHISKEADRDVNALVEICLYYQRLNPNLVITFKNPDAHFKEHILAHIWIEKGETFILQL